MCFKGCIFLIIAIHFQVIDLQTHCHQHDVKKMWFSDQPTFFHCSLVQLWCLCAPCRLWKQVMWGTKTLLWLQSHTHNKLCPNTILMHPVLTFSLIWDTVTPSLDCSTRASPGSPHALTFAHPWPCSQFTNFPFSNHFCFILTPANWEHPKSCPDPRQLVIEQVGMRG